MGKRSLIEIMENAIVEYNKYRSPEATARTISMNEASFKLEFRGSFCCICGFHDYFEDYQIK